MKTKDIFGHIIRYMKQKLLDDLKTRGNTVKEENILWVVTVPAIWNDGAKQFMREAALAVKDVIQTCSCVPCWSFINFISTDPWFR